MEDRVKFLPWLQNELFLFDFFPQYTAPHKLVLKLVNLWSIYLALMDGFVYANMDNTGGNFHSINSIMNIVVVEIKAIIWWEIQV